MLGLSYLPSRERPHDCKHDRQNERWNVLIRNDDLNAHFDGYRGVEKFGADSMGKNVISRQYECGCYLEQVSNEFWDLIATCSTVPKHRTPSR